MQQVKDLMLSLLCLGLLLWRGFEPWPGDVHMPWVWLKKQKHNQPNNNQMPKETS